MSEPIVLTKDNFRAELKGTPRLAKMAAGLALKIRYGSLEVQFPDGRRFHIKGQEAGPHGVLKIHNWAFFRMVVQAGDVGVGEAFMAGYWSSPDVTTFLEVFCINQESTLEALQGKPFTRFIMSVRHWLNSNTKRGAKRNISAHYDLGNAFYREWLDPSMTYSSAIYSNETNDLEQAQREKYASLVRQTGIQPDHRVLEIGCGWGGFAEYVAKSVGANVRALTISQEQFDYARERIYKAGLNDKVEVVFQDYRDENGVFDRIASIEMFEAVGEKYWPTYFRQLSKCLKPGGMAGLQIITIQDKMFDDYRRGTDFIQRYIFPGGMLPPPGRLAEIGKSLGLDLMDQKIFGQDYARTLAEWRQRFRQAWPRISPLGFDERFKRLWEFYLHYCEAGFRSGNIDVRQMVYVKSA
ncbi:SAM-dependent methyltransferase [Roseibium aggregatum]|jgi:cyclopropane-fatty-acyl-phospholipid synthase|uniref:Cyclopropane-fatty-acyl-phospholipid synthase n=1 Tax=Roseibium aggregatum (strain ATCC 25650 / DSM 13394 / JCM 20685 / NBRC 16684 / NCIMB 2208 / IAM 12614 / B1) TaxID=384765 RepID=A0NQF7_ROSAI|nr:cyclopropane-fatty-acyl-phospholipid synthase family protein [Roseibium aggregatum]EAV45015.1 Cyclopropane-fatty-acyl-phospholipid synthase [Stappia aggregata IAM 12614] [Roseibium aggregatum IAM 12614]